MIRLRSTSSLAGSTTVQLFGGAGNDDFMLGDPNQAVSTVDNINTAVRMVTVKRELAMLRKDGLMAVSCPTMSSARIGSSAPGHV